MKKNKMETKKVVLMTENTDLVVPASIIRYSVTIRNLVGDLGDDQEGDTMVPLIGAIHPNTVRHIATFTEMCDKNGDKEGTVTIGNWSNQWLGSLGEDLISVANAAEYLEFTVLSDIIRQHLRSLIKTTASVDHLRRLFRLTDDLLPQEKDHISGDTPWCDS